MIFRGKIKKKTDFSEDGITGKDHDGMKSLKISLFVIPEDSRATAAARRCCRLCPWATWQGFFPSKLIKGDSDVSESCSGKCLAATFLSCM